MMVPSGSFGRYRLTFLGRWAAEQQHRWVLGGDEGGL
jgi:hypothetical protein